MLRFAHFALAQTNKSDWMEYKKDAEGTVKHEKWQISSFDEWVSEWVRGALKIHFRKKLGIWPNQRTPHPLPVSWAGKKRKKSLMFILHFMLF